MAAKCVASPRVLLHADPSCPPPAPLGGARLRSPHSASSHVALLPEFKGAAASFSRESRSFPSYALARRRGAGVIRGAAAAGSTLPEKSEEIASEKADRMRVADVMTRNLIKVTADTSVDRALEILVENRITGMPVVDADGKLIGVVSDYDVLALDTISGKREADTALFPQAGSTWKAFKEIQKLLLKTRGRSVGEVMTPSPLVVRPLTNLESAARLLLESKYRRLPVVDENGKLVGLLTRGNVVRAALDMKRAMECRDA